MNSTYAVGLPQLYDNDPRPTFIVDCNAGPVSICHVNAALAAIPRIASELSSPAGDSAIFRDWWDPSSTSPGADQDEFEHGGFRWIKFTVCDRWEVVTVAESKLRPPLSSDGSHGNSMTAVERPATVLPNPIVPTGESIFTANIFSPALRQHIDYVRQVDWAATSLGPISSWSAELNRIIMQMMLETRPTSLLLGPDSTILYNPAYARICGKKHPRMIGQSVTHGWPEIADIVKARIDETRGSASADQPEEEQRVMIDRGDHIEEAYFSWALTPLVGQLEGIYNMCTETTNNRILERRVNALLRLGEMTRSAIEFDAFWTSVLEAIRPYEYDFPAAVLYSITESDTASSVGSGRSGSRNCSLEGTIGYPDDYRAIPRSLDLDEDEGLARAMSISARRGPTLFRKENDLLPEAFFHNANRGFADPCKAFIICPVRPISEETLIGFLVVGLNTRRPYDHEYEEWIQVFTKLLGTSAASVALHEDEVRARKRAAEQAERDRTALTGELAVATQEANDVAGRLQTSQDIADRVGVGFFEYDVTGKLLHANDAFFVQSGHPEDLPNAPEFSFVDRIYPEDKDVTMRMWDMLLAGSPVRFEMRWKREPSELAKAKGDTRDYIWILCACAPIKTLDGTVIRMSGCNTDVTAQKETIRAAVLRAEALERASASEKRLISYTEMSPVGYCRLDMDYKLLYANTRWFEITGHPVVPIDEIDWPPVLYEEDLEPVLKEVAMITSERKPRTFFFRTKKIWEGPDGIQTPTWIQSTATVENDEKGEGMSIIATMTDVSQLRWAENIQKVRVEEALESKRQQENFIDMTSHEMRNPLSAMVQCADSISVSMSELMSLVRKGIVTDDDELRAQLQDLIEGSIDALETIQACATHQKRIVDDILTLSKLDSKLLLISPVVTRPSALLQDTYKMFKDEAYKAGVDFEVRDEQSIDDLKVQWALLDPSRVLQVLINLITNAIKFTQDQAVRKVEVTMGASHTPAQRPGIEYVPPEASSKNFLDSREGEIFYLHFTVKDTGCGLTPEHKNKLFLRFSQATPKTHVQYGGSGLGLFISRELTEMQAGAIGVQSEQGQGSTFSFYIKTRRGNPQQRTSDVNLAQAFDHNALAHRPQSPLHILVVEDNVINQRVLSSQLQKIGCTVQVAGHGGEALEQLRKTKYWKQPTMNPPLELSVVLMDIEMPIMDGLTCARRIRELQEKGDIVGHVPIIAVSANARREQIEQASEAGMDDAISKPFRIPELLPKIQMLVERQQG